ncbi:MAG: HisA/HisF-related TIM barrel protein, partial [Lachnospiraceae bacterium]
MVFDKDVKTFVPCLYLKEGRAMEGPVGEKVLSDDPVSLAKDYAAKMADAVLVEDLSETEEEFAGAVSCLRTICSSIPVPVLAMGRIRRLSDVKDLVYAGCQMAVLDLSRADNRDLAKEAAEKLGKDRIAGTVSDAALLQEVAPLVKESLSLLVLTKPEAVEACEKDAPVSCLGVIEDFSEEALLAFFQAPHAAGVTGPSVSAGAEKIRSLRQFLLEHDFAVNARRAVFSWEELKKDPQGLVPVVVQEAYTDRVLMVAYMDENAYRKTIETG